MRKVRLDLDALEVETFATDGAGSQDGTVQGHSGPSAACSADPNHTCFDPETCWDSCPGTCDATCPYYSEIYYQTRCI